MAYLQNPSTSLNLKGYLMKKKSIRDVIKESGLSEKELTQYVNDMDPDSTYSVLSYDRRRKIEQIFVKEGVISKFKPQDLAWALDLLGY